MSDGYDAIIVGSGAGGGTAARVLTQRGLRVLVLERGLDRNAEEFLPYDELHFLEHKALQPGTDDPNVYVDPSGTTHKVQRWWIGNMVGGSTMLWEANLPRYTDEDFRVGAYLRDMPSDVSMPDWPWTYEEFQPWFERAEHEWGVSGAANQSPVQEPTRPGYEFPMPPLRLHGSVPYIEKVFGRAGMYPYRSPRGINSRTYDSRPGCPFCGYCQGFGCAVNDRASSRNTVLARALTTGLCDLRTGHYVTRLVHEQGRIRGAAYKTAPDAEEQVVEAPRVIVSIQAIQSARLFLFSEIPNPNDLVGRYLTYHTKGSAEFTFPNQSIWGPGRNDIYQPTTGLGSLQLRDLYVIDDPETGLSKGGKFSIYDPLTVNPPIKMTTGTGNLPSKGRQLWGKDLLDRLVELRSEGGVSFSFTGETMSRYDNRVELDPEVKDGWGVPVARVHYQHHDYDVELSRYALERVAGIVTDSGGQLRAMRVQSVANPGYGHNHGSLRAGADRDDSVLDPDCQSWEVRGLYVLDCAFMPTAGASNPTMTMLANAYRVCEGMA